MILSFLKPKKSNFIYSFFEKGLNYPSYSNIKNNSNGQDFFYVNNKPIDGEEICPTLIGYIPPYFNLIPKNGKTFYKYHEFSGFLANLEGFSNIEDYMKHQFRSKNRSRMRGYLRRLETCFDIHYKIYYGAITKEEFKFLWDRCKQMIETRFLQKGDIHQATKEWDFYETTTYTMIQDKKASFFVIYDGKKAIDICLNYHHQNIVYNAIRSFDTDYSKFKLGYIDILKQLEWCFTENHTIFDLTVGDFDYKRSWCNVNYDFEHHVLFNKNSFNEKIKSLILVNTYILKAFLRKKDIDLLYRKVISVFKQTRSNGNRTTNPIIETQDLNELFSEKIEINYNDKEYDFLRNSVYNFQYLNFEPTENINVYKLNDTDKSFIISGKNKNQLVKINI